MRLAWQRRLHHIIIIIIISHNVKAFSSHQHSNSELHNIQSNNDDQNNDNNRDEINDRKKQHSRSSATSFSRGAFMCRKNYFGTNQWWSEKVASIHLLPGEQPGHLSLKPFHELWIYRWKRWCQEGLTTRQMSAFLSPFSLLNSLNPSSLGLTRPIRKKAGT